MEEWVYCLSLDAFGRRRLFLESDLEPTGEFDTEDSQLGNRHEIKRGVPHKVFKARSLLYAQRLVVRRPESPWGRWHRAYAYALAGRHRRAIEDLAGAKTLAEAGRISRPRGSS